jgi:uncharacterized protein
MAYIIVQPPNSYALNDCRTPIILSQFTFGDAERAITEDCRYGGMFNDCRSEQPLHDCRSPQPTPPLPSAELRQLRPHPLLQMLALDNDHVVAFVPSFSQVAVLDRAAQALLDRLSLGDLPLDAITLDHLVALERMGLLTIGDGSIAPPPESDVLVAWLHVTNACNLRCSYCYLNKTNESMSESTGRAAIDAVVCSARANGYRKIALKYAGGEAALQMPLVELIHTYATEQTAAYGIQCQAGLLSNGTSLTQTKLDTIRRLGLQLMISLDGLAEINDLQRPTIAGNGSSRAVFAGIERAVAAGITPNIAITVTGASVVGLPSLVAWLLDRELPFTISFYREKDCGGSFQQLQLDEQRIVAGMRAAYAVIERNLPRWSLLGSLLDRADLAMPHQRTCAVGEHYLVIDHHGRIAKCQMTIEQPVTTIATDNPLALIRADQAGVQNVPVDQKEGCRSCEWRYWCTGGCAVATFRATGRYDIQSPNCGIYKALYPDVLRLEGRRLLYWQAHHQPSPIHVV